MSEEITLKVEMEDQLALEFTIPSKQKLGKIKRMFAKKAGLALENIRFLYDGKFVRDDSSAISMEMEPNSDTDEIIIEVKMEQTSGDQNGDV